MAFANRKPIDKTLYKGILFYEKISNSVELLVRLKNDKLNGSKFFRAVIQAYLNNDELFMAWYYNDVVKIQKTPKNRLEKRKQLFKEGEQLASDYYLNDEDIENIFDIIENIEDIEY